jgi:hypothetical protein
LDKDLGPESKLLIDRNLVIAPSSLNYSVADSNQRRSLLQSHPKAVGTRAKILARKDAAAHEKS